MEKLKILVIGDSCIDEFIYCDIERICPEAPVPVLKPKKSSGNPGMADNVVANLQALGVEVDIITNDINIINTRYVDDKSGQMIVRVDENDQCDRIDITKFVRDYTTNNIKYDAIVVSDYNKGFLHPADMNVISSLRMDCPVFLDSKRKFDEFDNGKWCYTFNYIKINYYDQLIQFHLFINIVLSFISYFNYFCIFYVIINPFKFTNTLI